MAETDTPFQFGTLQSDTGATLALYHHEAQGPTKAAVHVLHGLAEHAGRYARFAGALSAAGYAVYAHDHRGHGRTTVPNLAPHVFAKRRGWDAVIADTLAVNRHIHDRHPGLPVILFGHSMGGMASATYTMRHADTVDATAVWNASLTPRKGTAILKLIARTEAVFKGRAGNSVINAIIFGDWNKSTGQNRTSEDWLSRDEAEVDRYIADPLCGWQVPVSMWLDLADAVAEGSSDANLAAIPHDHPFYLLGGADDPATDGGAAIRHLESRLKTAGFSNVTAVVLPDTRHETLNELNRDEATRDFIAWLHGTVGNIQNGQGSVATKAG